jgi:glycosyltransferase involved in cell wall biosynthesis
MKNRNLIAISYAKRTLQPGSREYQRMQSYAALLTSYHIIVFTRVRDGFPSEQHDGSLHLYATNARTKIGMLWRSYLIGKTILRKSPENSFVVSSQDPFESSLVGRALARTRNATHHVQIHGDLFNPANYMSSVLQRLRVVYGRFVVRHASMIRVVSHRIESSLLKLGVPAKNMQVLPVQADIQSLLDTGRSRSYQSNSPLKLVFLGRLAPEKQIPLLLYACHQLQKKHISYSLQIVGSGPEENNLRALIKKLQLQNSVTLTPWVGDVQSTLKEADVLCLTSAHEGWGMVLLEAAAAGLPIVSTDVGCVGELFVDQQSILVAGTAEQFATAIGQLQDPNQRMQFGSAALSVAEQFVAENDGYVEKYISGQFPE